MNTNLITLTSEHARGSSQVIVDPLAGAAICAYRSLVDEQEICWFQSGYGPNFACFAMVPFCSRISDGQFSFAQQDISLPANLPPELHAIHGHGFQQPWEVDALTQDTVRLSYAHSADSWPWSYHCEQRISLHAEALSIELVLTNKGNSMMPYGMGLHPCFPKHDGLVLTANVATHLQLNDNLLPVVLQAVPEPLLMHNGLRLDEQVLDDVFCGWQHEAQLNWVGQHRSLLMKASVDCDKLVVWAPSGQRFCCIEPISNLPDGFNQGERLPNAFSILEAGASHSMACSFHPHQA